MSVSSDMVTIQGGKAEASRQASPEIKPAAVKVDNNAAATSAAPKTAVWTEQPPQTIAVIEESPAFERTPHAEAAQEKTQAENTGKEGEVKKQYDKNFVPGESAKLIHTKSTVENMTKLARSIRQNENVLLVGPTEAGKTAIVKYMAYLTNNGLRRINLNDMTDITEIIGGYKPNDQGHPEWSGGILLDAMKNGHWVVLDEVNLAEPAILERINSLLDGDRSLVLMEKGNERIEAHPNFRIFMTMNPATHEYGGRSQPVLKLFLYMLILRRNRNVSR